MLTFYHLIIDAKKSEYNGTVFCCSYSKRRGKLDQLVDLIHVAYFRLIELTVTLLKLRYLVFINMHSYYACY